MFFIFIKHHVGLLSLIINDSIFDTLLRVFTEWLDFRINELSQLYVLFGIANKVKNVINLIVNLLVSLKPIKFLLVH